MGWDRKKTTLDRIAALLTALLLFNYNTLSSANCKSFCNLNRFYDDAYSELLILEDDSGETIALPDSFCNVDVTPEDDSDDSDTETCPYCQACNMGAAIQHIPPLLLVFPAILDKKIISQKRSSLPKRPFFSPPQRAPPTSILRYSATTV